jgi:serine/threonine protein kinase
MEGGAVLDAPLGATKPRPTYNSAASSTTEGSGSGTPESRVSKRPSGIGLRSSKRSMEKAPGLSDFAILGKLGEGGFGTVLLGRHKATGNMSAIKVLLKASIKNDVQAERVLGEAQALGEVNHPFIVAMQGAFQDETHIFFVLEYISGGDLYARLCSHGAMEPAPGRVICAEVALALSHLHSRGYMYRDLKSENVLVCCDGHIKLTDFGLAKKMDVKRQERTTMAPNGSTRRTMRHSRMIGTPDALAPEVMGIEAALDEKRDYGPGIDWWGLGILTSEVMTGLEPVLVASGETEVGRRLLSQAYRNGMHVNIQV